LKSKRAVVQTPTRIKAQVPVRRNSRDMGVPTGGAILDPEAGSGLQDLAQINRAIQVPALILGFLQYTSIVLFVSL
jgi:hypothetical protein